MPAVTDHGAVERKVSALTVGSCVSAGLSKKTRFATRRRHLVEPARFDAGSTDATSPTS